MILTLSNFMSFNDKISQYNMPDGMFRGGFNFITGAKRGVLTRTRGLHKIFQAQSAIASPMGLFYAAMTFNSSLLIAFSRTGIFKQGASDFDLIVAPNLTGDGNDFFSAVVSVDRTVTPWLEKIVVTNGNDNVKIWDVANDAGFRNIKDGLSDFAIKAKVVTWWRSRLFMFDVEESGSRFVNKVRFSSIGDPEEWSGSTATSGFINLDLAPGEEIMGAAQIKDSLIVLCTHSIFTLTVVPGINPIGMSKINIEHGCVARGTISVVNDIIYYLSFSGIIMFDGNRIVNITDGLWGFSSSSSSYETNPSFSRDGDIALNYIEKSSMAYNQETNSLYLSYPKYEGVSNNTHIAVIDLSVGGLTFITFFGASQLISITQSNNALYPIVSDMTDIISSYYQTIENTIIGSKDRSMSTITQSGYVKMMNRAYLDDGNEYDGGKLETGWYDMGDISALKRLTRVTLLVSNPSEFSTFSLQVDIFFKPEYIEEYIDGAKYTKTFTLGDNVELTKSDIRYVYMDIPNGEFRALSCKLSLYNCQSPFEIHSISFDYENIGARQ